MVTCKRQCQPAAPLRLSLLMGCTAALIAVAALSDAPASFAADAKARTVSLVVDYGDGAEVRFKSLPWRDGMTAFDALDAAKKHPHGITFEKRGREASTLVTQIDDLKNEGDGKNWLFSVNGKTARVGAGAYQLKSGDAVLWEFKVYEYN